MGSTDTMPQASVRDVGEIWTNESQIPKVTGTITILYLTVAGQASRYLAGGQNQPQKESDKNYERRWEWTVAQLCLSPQRRLRTTSKGADKDYERRDKRFFLQHRSRWKTLSAVVLIPFFLQHRTRWASAQEETTKNQLHRRKNGGDRAAEAYHVFF